MAWVTNCPKCGHNRVYNHDAGTCYVCTPKTGPAPKEEEMNENHPVIGRLMDVAEKAVCDAARTAERRALARDAYMAALGGLCSNQDSNTDDDVRLAIDAALETVRRWDAFLAAVDAEGGE